MTDNDIRRKLKLGLASRDRKESSDILILGLGRFGSSLAYSLIDMGHHVLAVDQSEELVERHRDRITHVLVADTTDERVLRQIGADQFETCVVCIGTDIESSTLTTVALSDLGIPNIWAKAINSSHAKILSRVGARHVVRPEEDMGRRVAHLLGGAVLEYLALDDDFVIVETRVPAGMVGRSLGEAGLRDEYKVTVVCIKPLGGTFTYAERTTVPNKDDLIVVAGPRSDVDRFIRRADEVG
ncbi:MAG: potassium channel family protein [Actinomycetota bacterium]